MPKVAEPKASRDIITLVLDKNPNITVDINYTYHPYQPGSHVDQPESEGVEIHEVFFNDKEVSDLITCIDIEYFAKLERMILEKR